MPVVSGTDTPVTIGAIWSCAGSLTDATRASIVWWLDGCVTAESCLYVVPPGAENPPEPTGRWHVPDALTWQSHADNLGFAPGQTQRTITIPIIDDGIDEPDKTVELALTEPTGTGVRLGAAARATLTIVDDEPTPPPPPR